MFFGEGQYTNSTQQAHPSWVERQSVSTRRGQKESWLEQLGLGLRDEQTGKKLTGSGGDTTTIASDVPQAWGPCESIYLTNVPPYWKEEVLRSVLLTQGTGQRNFVVDKGPFRIRQVRSKTWMMTDPSVSQVPRKVLQAANTNMGTIMVPMSAQEYKSKCAQLRSKGKGKEKGADGTGATGCRGKPDTSTPMERSSTDMPALNFMKRKRTD